MAGHDRWGQDRDHRRPDGRERPGRDRETYGDEPDHFTRFDRESFARPDRPGEHSRDFPGRGEYRGNGMGRDTEAGRDWHPAGGGGFASRRPGQEYGRGSGRGPGGWDDHDRTERGGYSGRDRSLGEMAFGRDQSGRDDPGHFGRSRADERRGGFFGRMGEEVASWFGGSDDEEHLRRLDLRDGAHRGRGPKSYQRSDERILEDVNDRLTEDPQLDASEVEVSVSGREVTLSGTVSNRYDKRRAEDLADSVSGVIHVQNNLRVRGTSGRTSWSDEGAANRTDITGVGHSGGGRPDKAES
jgi:hypothetical protein